MAVEYPGTGQQQGHRKRDSGEAGEDAGKVEKVPAEDGSPDLGVKLLPASVLWGCNAHHRDTVIVQAVDLAALAGESSGRAGPTFASRFIERFGALRSLGDQSALEPSFGQRLQSGGGVDFVEVLFRAILAVEAASLQAMRRLQGTEYRQIHRGSDPRYPSFIWSSPFPDISRRAAEVGLLGFSQLLPDELRAPSVTEQGSYDQALTQLIKSTKRHRPLPPAAILIDAAERKGIPWEHIGGNVMRLGQGRNQHRIWSTITSKTSRVADRLAQDKVATHRVLADAGLPVPRQIFVANLREARAAAEEIGYPVVVKPLGGNTGKGVSANLKSRKDIPKAYTRAREIGSEVVVESFVEGDDHRLLVIGGRVVAAAMRVPPSVVGDGERTIAELIDELNSDPLRDNFRRAEIKIDHELGRLLELSGYGMTTVLPSGEAFKLRSTANVSTGGFTKDVTDVLHPDNREMAIRAAEAVGLDVAGVDYLTTDVTQSYRQIGGGIVEVNSRPGLRPHVWPVEGEARDVGSMVIETMFPPGDEGRVPIGIVAGNPSQGSAIADRSAALLRRSGMAPAVALSEQRGADDGMAVAEIEPPLDGVLRPLRDLKTGAMVRSVSLSEIAERGLLIDACQAAAVPDSGIDEDGRLGLEIILQATKGCVACSADQTLPEVLASRLGTGQLILVSAKGRNDLVRQHLDGDGTAVYAQASPEAVNILLAGPSAAVGAEKAALAVATLPPQSSEEDIEAQAFAVALALGMGLSPAALR